MSKEDDVINRLERIEKTLGSATGTPVLKMADNYKIFRTYSAGVFAGELVSRNGGEAVVNNCRRLWYWSGAASLSQMAVDGTSKPKDCKFTVPTNGHELIGVIEIIPCTEKAQKSIREVAEWKV